MARVRTRAYHCWNSLVQRCTNPKNPSYKHYGGRGIGVCERWMNADNFIADMGEPDTGMSIDRIDNNKGYSPENCRWVSTRQNSRNTRKSLYVVYKGQDMHVQDACEAAGISLIAVYKRRYNTGVDAQKAFDHYVASQQAA